MNINEKTTYITITGMQHYYGTPAFPGIAELFKRGVVVTLKKDHENEYDNEAIEVRFPGLGKIGYVANSVRTVIGESSSAGRIYDRFGEETEATVYAVLPDGLICTMN